MNNKPTCHPETTERGQQFLSIEEKRAWLARIFRDTSGEYSDADKLKAMEADTRLAMLTPNRQEKLDSSSCQPKVDYWEEPRICVTCIHFKNCQFNGNPYFCEDASEPNPCYLYSPKTK